MNVHYDLFNQKDISGILLKGNFTYMKGYKLQG